VRNVNLKNIEAMATALFGYDPLPTTYQHYAFGSGVTTELSKTSQNNFTEFTTVTRRKDNELFCEGSRVKIADYRWDVVKVGVLKFKETENKTVALIRVEDDPKSTFLAFVSLLKVEKVHVTPGQKVMPHWATEDNVQLFLDSIEDGHDQARCYRLPNLLMAHNNKPATAVPGSKKTRSRCKPAEKVPTKQSSRIANAQAAKDPTKTAATNRSHTHTHTHTHAHTHTHTHTNTHTHTQVLVSHAPIPS
jgi:hypothetical protein